MTRAAVILFMAALLVGCGKPAQPKRDPGHAPIPQKDHASDPEEHVATGPFDGDCNHSGKNPNGVFQFMVPCPASFASPDGRWELVMGKEGPNEDDYAPVTLERGDGSRFAGIPELSDGMPFQVLWSARPNWFLAVHHVGSFMDRPEMYEITRHRVVSHDAFRRQALRRAQRLFPCLPRKRGDWANGWTIGLSKDGRRLAWIFVTRTDMCNEMWGGKGVSFKGGWKNFLMISDVVSGAIEPGSVRIIEEPEKFEVPRDAMYAEFREAAPTSASG